MALMLQIILFHVASLAAINILNWQSYALPRRIPSKT